uniref:Uncharacterized protein n=1 Tax=Arion vulgaris TaxID=1028688 RepID=A0A0B6Z3N6_9EUPU
MPQRNQHTTNKPTDETAVKAAHVQPVRSRHAIKVKPGSSTSASVPPRNLTKV